MKSLIRNFVTLATLFTLCTAAHAQSGRSVEDIYKQCGIGGLIFGQSSPTLAFISNVTWDLGTTAATSDATNGCSVGTSDTMAAVYIHETYEQLETELAIGQGEYLEALTSLMSCEGTNAQAVQSELRSAFSGVVRASGYASMDSFAKSDSLYQLVAPQLTDSPESACTAA